MVILWMNGWDDVDDYDERRERFRQQRSELKRDSTRLGTAWLTRWLAVVDDSEWLASERNGIKMFLNGRRDLHHS